MQPFSNLQRSPLFYAFTSVMHSFHKNMQWEASTGLQNNDNQTNNALPGKRDTDPKAQTLLHRLDELHAHHCARLILRLHKSKPLLSVLPGVELLLFSKLQHTFQEARRDVIKVIRDTDFLLQSMCKPSHLRPLASDGRQTPASTVDRGLTPASMGWDGMMDRGLRADNTMDRGLRADNTSNAPAARKDRPGSKKRRRSALPRAAVSTLRAWLLSHVDHPYPTDGEKNALVLQTGLTQSQVNYWFINARVRIVRPLKRAIAASVDSNAIKSTVPAQ